MPARFPYLPVASGRGDALLMPVLPLELRFKEGDPVQAHGLLDSGATVNVLPYRLGVRLGAVWEAQTTRVTLAGNLAAQEARALLVRARLAHDLWLPPIAWQNRLAEMQAEVDALKRLQAETAADPPSFYFGATWLDALLPAILDKAFKGKL